MKDWTAWWLPCPNPSTDPKDARMSSTNQSAAAAIHAAARARIDAMALDEINPADPQGFVDDTVGYVFDRLRREDPVHRSHSPIPGIDSYWSE